MKIDPKLNKDLYLGESKDEKLQIFNLIPPKKLINLLISATEIIEKLQNEEIQADKKVRKWVATFFIDNGQTTTKYLNDIMSQKANEGFEIFKIIEMMAIGENNIKYTIVYRKMILTEIS